jgi:hypothetical protein
MYVTYFAYDARPDVIQHADNAQHAFSSENTPTLYHAIPALEALYRAWSSRAARPKYRPFAAALRAACSKVDDYHGKTTQSPAYILSMSTFLYCIVYLNVPDILLF